MSDSYSTQQDITILHITSECFTDQIISECMHEYIRSGACSEQKVVHIQHNNRWLPFMSSRILALQNIRDSPSLVIPELWVCEQYPGSRRTKIHELIHSNKNRPTHIRWFFILSESFPFNVYLLDPGYVSQSGHIPGWQVVGCFLCHASHPFGICISLCSMLYPLSSILYFLSPLH